MLTPADGAGRAPALALTNALVDQFLSVHGDKVQSVTLCDMGPEQLESGYTRFKEIGTLHPENEGRRFLCNRDKTTVITQMDTIYTICQLLMHMVYIKQQTYAI